MDEERERERERLDRAVGRTIPDERERGREAPRPSRGSERIASTRVIRVVSTEEFPPIRYMYIFCLVSAIPVVYSLLVYKVRMRSGHGITVIYRVCSGERVYYGISITASSPPTPTISEQGTDCI